MIHAIWAEDEQHLIGNKGRLPWFLPAELAHFKKTTLGHAMLMGRKTFDGMNKRILPGRQTIILTRDQDYDAENESVLVMYSKREVLDWYQKQADQELFVIGGAELFALFEDEFDQLFVTLVKGSFEGDTYFPTSFDYGQFRVVDELTHPADTNNQYEFSVRKYERK